MGVFFTHRFAHAKNTLMSQRGYTPLDTPFTSVGSSRPLDTPFTSVGSSRLSFGAFKGLGYSKVEPLFFYGSKFVFWADQN